MRVGHIVLACVLVCVAAVYSARDIGGKSADFRNFVNVFRPTCFGESEKWRPACISAEVVCVFTFLLTIMPNVTGAGMSGTATTRLHTPTFVSGQSYELYKK